VTRQAMVVPHVLSGNSGGKWQEMHGNDGNIVSTIAMPLADDTDALWSPNLQP
jgi:hypothetical protein